MSRSSSRWERVKCLSVTYVGAIGRDLLRVSNLINVNNNFGLIALTGNTATSDYHALQVKFERRLSRRSASTGLLHIFPFDR